MYDEGQSTIESGAIAKLFTTEMARNVGIEAIQIHGATGISNWTPLARMYTGQRTLRIADGPDEVHWFVVGRAELNRWAEEGGEYNPKEEYYAGLEQKEAVFSGP